MEHHYRIDIFLVAVDSQLREMNSRFKENVVELLVLSSALDPRDDYVSFKVDDICKFANKSYQEEFIEQEKLHLKFQLELFELVHQNFDLQKVSTILELCQVLVKTRNQLFIHLLID